MNTIDYFIIGYFIIGTILGRIAYYKGHKQYENSEEKLKHNWDWDAYENHNDINVLSALLTFFWIIVLIVYIIVRSYEILKKEVIMEKGVWIARDKNGHLAIFDDEPILDDNEWFNSRPFEGEYSCINKEMFPEITFENSPKQLIIKED